LAAAVHEYAVALSDRAPGSDMTERVLGEYRGTNRAVWQGPIVHRNGKHPISAARTLRNTSQSFDRCLRHHKFSDRETTLERIQTSERGHKAKSWSMHKGRAAPAPRAARHGVIAADCQVVGEWPSCADPNLVVRIPAMNACWQLVDAAAAKANIGEKAKFKSRLFEAVH